MELYNPNSNMNVYVIFTQILTTTEHNQKMFDETIHRENWEDGENYIAPRHHKNNEGDKEL